MFKKKSTRKLQTKVESDASESSIPLDEIRVRFEEEKVNAEKSEKSKATSAEYSEH